MSGDKDGVDYIKSILHKFIDIVRVLYLFIMWKNSVEYRPTVNVINCATNKMKLVWLLENLSHFSIVQMVEPSLSGHCEMLHSKQHHTFGAK